MQTSPKYINTNSQSEVNITTTAFGTSWNRIDEKVSKHTTEDLSLALAVIFYDQGPYWEATWVKLPIE